MSPHGASAVSVIVPTYREIDNVPVLVGRLKAVGATHALPLELLIVDDASNDGIASLPERLREARWMRVIVRHARRDLCQAVLDGLRAATGDVLVVMDADLSHPPEAIPSLLAALAHPDVDFVLASRYVAGGSTHPGWDGAVQREQGRRPGWPTEPAPADASEASPRAHARVVESRRRAGGPARVRRRVGATEDRSPTPGHREPDEVVPDGEAQTS